MQADELPVTAWVWKYANGEEEVVFVDASKIPWDPTIQDVPSKVTPLTDHATATSKLAELQRGVEDMGRILRSSVPERHKGCASPVGAVQSYIVELEQALIERGVDLAAIDRSLGEGGGNG